MPGAVQHAPDGDPSGGPAAADGAGTSGTEAAAAGEGEEVGLIGPQIGPQIGPHVGPQPSFDRAVQDSNGTGAQAPDHDAAVPSAEHAVQDGKRDRPMLETPGATTDEARPKKKPLLSFGDDDNDT